MRRARGLLAGAVTLLAVVLPSGTAAAACPSAPPAYSGDDALVAELRAQRIESAGACAELAARLDQLHDDDSASRSILATIAARVEGADSRPTTAAVNALRDVDDPLPVASAAAPADNSEVVQAVDASGADVRWLLSCLIGLALLALLVPAFNVCWGLRRA